MTIYPIVGQYYRPPAQAILGVLPSGCNLYLIPEPTNHVDPNAIMVVVETTEIPDKHHELLDTLAMGYGHSTASILEKEFWQLGYIPAKLAATLQPFEQKIGKLCFGPDGEAKVEF